MSTTAQEKSPRRRVWPMPMIVSWKRFGLGVVVASSAIAAVGFLLHVKGMPPPLASTVLPQQAGALMEKAAAAPAAEHVLAVRLMLDRFVEAMERQDEAGMRQHFPTLTGREARLLFGIRERLGKGAHLRVESQPAIVAADGNLRADFVILAQPPASERERRLPFSATVSNETGGWKIVTLR